MVKTNNLLSSPKKCDCGNPGVITRILVKNLKTGNNWLTAFAAVRGNKPGKKIKLREPFQFVAWVVECSDCYYQELSSREKPKHTEL